MKSFNKIRIDYSRISGIFRQSSSNGPIGWPLIFFLITRSSIMQEARISSSLDVIFVRTWRSWRVKVVEKEKEEEEDVRALAFA